MLACSPDLSSMTDLNSCLSPLSLPRVLIDSVLPNFLPSSAFIAYLSVKRNALYCLFFLGSKNWDLHFWVKLFWKLFMYTLLFEVALHNSSDFLFYEDVFVSLVKLV